ncbi:MAG: hypothetical protein RLZZ74_2991, partial [Cyanobacteriota bacterium]
AEGVAQVLEKCLADRGKAKSDTAQR